VIQDTSVELSFNVSLKNFDVGIPILKNDKISFMNIIIAIYINSGTSFLIFCYLLK